MVGRLAKVAMILALGLFVALVAYDNVADYATNYEYVRHVFSMDTTPPDNAERGRAITDPRVWQAAYAFIIAGEGAIAGLFLVAAAALWQARRGSAEGFQAAKRWVHAATAAAFLLWFLGFMVVGGEWFAMWRSRQWNGQEAAFRFIMILVVVAIYVNQRDEA